jgi:hypothetical protein
MLAWRRTHDKLWNAAQLQMVREGKMHGFLRCVEGHREHTSYSHALSDNENT